MKNPGICLWCDLSLEEVTVLEGLTDTQDIRRFLCVKHGFNCAQLTIRQKIIIDLYFYALMFARDKQFRQEQISALYSLIKRTHDKAIETPYGNTKDTFHLFQANLLCHTAKRPPFSVEIFNVTQVKEITDYMLNTYFRHFKLYKYAFTPKVTMNIDIQYEGVEDEVEVEAEDVGSEENTEEVGENADDEPLQNAPAEDVDPPAVKELKAIINKELDEQIQKLKLNIDSKFEDQLTTKASKASKPGSPPKSGRKTSNKKK